MLKIADARGRRPARASGLHDYRSRNDFLKAQEGRMYVPFTLTIPTEPAPPTGLMVYIRVAAKNPPVPAPAAPADKKDKKDDKDKGPEFAFEDAYPIDLKAPEAGQPYRFSRAFTVPAGEYELLVVLKERAPIEKDKKNKNPVYKTGVLKQALVIPDFWNGELATSSVILAADVSPLAAPLTPQEMKEQPYTLGTTKITPMPTSNKLPKKSELSVVFIIYNTQTDAAKKPDVVVEYSFHQKVATRTNGEKFFNKTNPQNFNATTLPPQFDPALGSPARGRAVGSAGELPRGRVPPRDQGDGQAGGQDGHAERAVLRRLVTAAGETPSVLQWRRRSALRNACPRQGESSDDDTPPTLVASAAVVILAALALPASAQPTAESPRPTSRWPGPRAAPSRASCSTPRAPRSPAPWCRRSARRWPLPCRGATGGLPSTPCPWAPTPCACTSMATRRHGATSSKSAAARRR